MGQLRTIIENAGLMIGTNILIGSLNDGGKRINDVGILKIQEFLTKDRSQNNFISEEGINYSELKRLLKQAYVTKNEDYWRKADFETYRLMLRAVHRGQSDWIRRHEMRNFPCSDLQIINSMWLKYSDGNFGLSVQNEIWKALRDKYSWDLVPYGKKFTEHVGWLNAQGRLKERDDLIFSIKAPRSHLPYLLRISGRLRKESEYWLFSYLSSRLDACSIL